MKEIIHGGATTILVSHSIEQVREMCSKILWLHKGRQVTFTDQVEEVCNQYQQFLNGRSPPHGTVSARTLRTVRHNEKGWQALSCLPALCLSKTDAPPTLVKRNEIWG